MTREELQEGICRAALEVLRPLVGQMLALGVRFGHFESRLRHLFVDVAKRELAASEPDVSDSRLSLLTGLNRKEVRRIRSGGRSTPAPASFSRNVAAEIFGRWRTRSGYSDGRGRPLPIPYRAKRGPSFARLVREVTVDLRPKLILQELARSGAVEIREGRVIARSGGAYVPRLGQGERLEMLTRDPRELVETMIRNIFSADVEPFLQRKVAYDNLDTEAIERIRAQLRRRGERFTRSVNRLLAHYDRDRNPEAPGGPRTYAGIGVYYFEGVPESPDIEDGEKPKSRSRKREKK